jgi:hypothetical protein
MPGEALGIRHYSRMSERVISLDVRVRREPNAAEAVLASIAPIVAASPARHYVVVLKECVVEVRADELTVERVTGSTGDAALVPLSRHASARFRALTLLIPSSSRYVSRR